MSSPRAIGSVQPYRSKAKAYVKYGWLNPIPLPHKKKNPPPSGFTGHAGKDVTEQQLEMWLSDADEATINYSTVKANIALRLNVVVREEINPTTGVTEDVYYELIGIDVDHHPDDPDDAKFGGDQLKSMEKRLGRLPDTYISSARANGVAGIRFYLWPVEMLGDKPQLLAWRGDCSEAGAPDIDIISRGYRFAAVYPSIHPNGEQYLWYPPGVEPSGPQALEGIDWTKYGYLEQVSDNPSPDRDLCRIPWASKLAVLPQTWARYLTRDFLLDPGASPMDMDISRDGLEKWCDKNFGAPRGMCDEMAKTLAALKVKVENSNTSHNVLYKGHMQLIKLGSKDGHSGWRDACEEFEKFWLDDVLSRSKRQPAKAKSEIKRSFFGALRKLKGRFDNNEFKFLGHDPCTVRIVDEDDENITFTVPTSPTRPTIEYERSDDGNAEHFLNMYANNLRYVVNIIGNWIIWDGHHWIVDQKGYVKHMYRAVKEQQLADGQQMLEEGLQQSDQAREKQGLALKAWGTKSGNVPTVKNALAAASVWDGIPITFEDINANPRLLCIDDNKVLNLADDGLTVEELKREMLITRSTGVPYIPMAKQKEIYLRIKRESGGYESEKLRGATTGDPQLDIEVAAGYELFWQYMIKFIKSSVTSETWKFLPKLFGQAILGHNEEKVIIFLLGDTDTGKSTFQNLLAKSLGDYAGWCSPKMFVNNRFNPDLADALSLHVVCIGEMGRSQIHSELLKNVTGNEPVSVELKGSNNNLRMKARCTIICGANAAPDIPGEDKATRNRFVVIPFRHQVVGEEKNPQASFELEEHGRIAMLAWLIEGCDSYLRDGGNLRPFPAEIAIETEEFTNQLSDVSTFINEYVIKCPEEYWKTYALDSEDPTLGKELFPKEWWLGDEDLWQAYRKWQMTHVHPNKQISSKNGLGRQLKGFGFKGSQKRKLFNGKQQKIWYGVKSDMVNNGGGTIKIKSEGS